MAQISEKKSTEVERFRVVNGNFEANGSVEMEGRSSRFHKGNRTFYESIEI